MRVCIVGLELQPAGHPFLHAELKGVVIRPAIKEQAGNVCKVRVGITGPPSRRAGQVVCRDRIHVCGVVKTSAARIDVARIQENSSRELVLDAHKKFLDVLHRNGARIVRNVAAVFYDGRGGLERGVLDRTRWRTAIQRKGRHTVLKAQVRTGGI